MDWALYREALILEEAGKLEEAILALKKLVGTSSDPGENSLPYLEIANCLRGLGRHGEAREYLRKAYETFGEDHRYYPNVMFIDASIEEEVGNYDAGLEKLDSIIKSFPDFLTNPEYEDLAFKVMCLRGVLLAETKKYKEAKPLLEAAIGTDYSQERILFYLGVSCCQ